MDIIFLLLACYFFAKVGFILDDGLYSYKMDHYCSITFYLIEILKNTALGIISFIIYLKLSNEESEWMVCIPVAVFFIFIGIAVDKVLFKRR